MSDEHVAKEDFVNLCRKEQEWDHLSSVHKWEKRWLRLFNEACSLLVHAHQIDMQLKKSDFIIPKKDIYFEQQELFDIENNNVFNINDFIKKAHSSLKELDEKEDKKSNQEVKTTVTVELEHFVKAISLCLKSFFEEKELKDLDIKDIKCNSLACIEHNIVTDSYAMQTKMPLFMILASCVTARKIRTDKLEKGNKNKKEFDLFHKGHINDLFLIYNIIKHDPFFEGETLNNCFFNSNKNEQTLSSTLMTICLYAYELYYFTHFFGEITKLSISLNYKQYVLDFISDTFIKLTSQVSFHKGIIISKIERARLNQQSPRKAVAKKSQLFATMVSEKGVTKDNTIKIKDIDLFRIFRHGDISIASDPTEKKYIKLAEEILKKKIHII